MTVEIPLTRGMVAIVCDCHAHLVTGYKWYANFNRSYYATRNDYSDPDHPKTIRMHRVIAGAKDGEFVDHIHHNTLDNRCSELRICTDAENRRNRKKIGKFIGVCFHKRIKKFQASIHYNGKQLCLGYFNTAEEAAKQRDKFAKIYYKEFATLNFE